jgi:hypothetical protein
MPMPFYPPTEDVYTWGPNAGIQQIYEYMFGPPGTDDNDHPHPYDDVPTEGIRLRGRTLDMPSMLSAEVATIVMQLIEAIEQDELTELRVILQYYRDRVMTTPSIRSGVMEDEIIHALEDRNMCNRLIFDNFTEYHPPYCIELFIEDGDDYHSPEEWVICSNLYEIIVQFIDLW